MSGSVLLFQVSELNSNFVLNFNILFFTVFIFRMTTQAVEEDKR